jgi:Protein of unknown function (DUF2911)
MVIALASALLLASMPPAPPGTSPPSTLSQRVGLCEVTLQYSRAAASGGAIWGDTVPWGQLWRSDGDAATTLELSHDAEVQGRPIAAGTYTLWAIPNREVWTLVFSRTPADPPGASYDPTLDALRVQARPREAPYQESLEMTFPDVGTDTVRVELHWAGVAVPFDITFDVRAAAVQAAREFVPNATPADGRAVWTWANYFYQNGYNTSEALTWATELAESAPMYFTYALQARLLAVNGRHAEAVAAGERALALAGRENAEPGVQADAEELARLVAEWRAP